MASSNALNRPHPPPSPPPTPDEDTTIIIVGFVSVGCVLFLAFFVFVVCYLVRKRCKKRVEKTETAHVDEHLKVKETIVDGPRGPHAVVISVEDDVRIEEEVKKEEKKSIGKVSKARGWDGGDQSSVGSSSNMESEQYYSPIQK